MAKELMKTKNNIAFIKNSVFWIISIVAVIIIFQITYGVKIIWPANISWLMTVMHDWGTHYLGWYFYKNEPWHFPIGAVSNYFYPIGTNVGFTDSIPLLAIFFKLFKPVLPEDFQYFGLWLFLCHLLSAYFTIRLFGLFKIKKIYTFIAVLFIVSNPVLVFRGLHPALCAQWLLIASIYVYFQKPVSNHQVKKILLYQFILLALSSLINPYLCFMVLGFSFVTVLKLCFIERAIKIRHLTAYLSLTFLALLLLWYIIGMISFGKKENLGVEGGFGLYSLNLNSLYNPGGYSAIFPSQKQVSWHQYEGFMYLGAGISLLAIIMMLYGLYFSIKKDKTHPTIFNYTLKDPRLIPLFILLFCFLLFAITNTVTLSNKILFTIPVPDTILKLSDIFRASARFFWPIYYLIFYLCIIAVIKSNLKESLKTSILVIALCLQWYDTKPLLTSRNLTYGSYTPPIDVKNWTALINEFDQISFYPPFQASYLTNLDYQYFSYLAARARKPLNIGYVARSDNHAMKLYIDSMENALGAGNLSPSTLYITTSNQLSHFSLPLQLKTCQLNMLDNYYYLFSSDTHNKNALKLSTALNDSNKKILDSTLQTLSKKIEFIETKKPGYDENITFNLERVINGKAYVYVNGWAFINNEETNKGDSVLFFLDSEKDTYVGRTTIFHRPDLTKYFKKVYLDDAGFDGIIFTDSVKKGKYKLGIAIKKAMGNITYQLTDSIIKIGISEYANPEKIVSLPAVDSIDYGIDLFELSVAEIHVGGWAAFKNQDADDCEISLILKTGTQIYLVITDPTLRPDVTNSRNKKYNLDHSGFNSKILKTALLKGNYQLGILVKNNKSKREGMIFINKQIPIF